MSDSTIWQREGNVVVGLLVREIKLSKTWHQIVEASDAIFHVRLMQKGLEKESAYLNGDTNEHQLYEKEVDSEES